MTDHDTATLDPIVSPAELDVGTPVEWMVDPDRRTIILGVTYEFCQTGARKTVWYTPNKRRAKSCVILKNLAADP